jgi:ribosomal protein S18 acetylase RimI-like enzyme
MLACGALRIWACFGEDAVCGVIAVRPPAHLSLLFVDSRCHNQGIARAMFEYALFRLSGTEMTVNSSPYAVGFYRKMGFVETDREQTVNGIRFVPMKRSL